jgi:hypothetical protein
MAFPSRARAAGRNSFCKHNKKRPESRWRSSIPMPRQRLPRAVQGSFGSSRLLWQQRAWYAPRVLHGRSSRSRQAPALFVRRRLSPILELTTERPDIGPGRLQQQQQLFPEGPSLGDVRVLLRSDPDSRKHLTTRTLTGNRSIEVNAYARVVRLSGKAERCTIVTRGP